MLGIAIYKVIKNQQQIAIKKGIILQTLYLLKIQIKTNLNLIVVSKKRFTQKTKVKTYKVPNVTIKMN
jgi:hypothetical protein